MNSRHLNLHVLTFINQCVLAKTCFVLTMMYSAAPKGTLALIRLSEQKRCLYSCSHTTPSPIDGNERRLREPVSNEATCSPAWPSKNGFTKYPGNTGGSGFCFAVIFHPVQKMNIYESRKVMPKREMHSAGRLSDSWPMPEESGRQINKSRPRGCDRVTKNWPLLQRHVYTFLCIRASGRSCFIPHISCHLGIDHIQNFQYFQHECQQTCVPS